MSMTLLSRLRPHVAGFFAFREKPGQRALMRTAEAAFAGSGWKVLAVPVLRAALGAGVAVVGDRALARRCSLLVSLGGDGTLLGAAALAAPLGRPVLGLNLGGLGFITAFGPSALDAKLRTLLKGPCRLETRRMVRAEVRRAGRRVLLLDAVNDLVLARPEVGRLARMQASVDGRFLAAFRADGLIFSSPTGSTAYNLSVGGPLVDPASPVLLLSLISPHTLSYRPLVLPDDSVLELKPEGGLEIAADGRRGLLLKDGDTVRLKRSPLSVKLVLAPDHDPWAVLRDKLGWQGATPTAGVRRA
jgi:NAD+ kinase